MPSTSLVEVAPGVRLAAHEALDTRDRGERNLLVLHALGLNSLAYRPFVDSFLEASGTSVDADLDVDPDDESGYGRVVFLDLRHHGDSEAASASLEWAKGKLWETLARDLASAVRALRFSSPPDVLAHSLGAGVAAVAAAAAAAPLFGSLFLFEPPFYPLVAAGAVAPGGRRRDLSEDNASFAASAAAASVVSFENLEEAAQLLQVASPFKWWHESCRAAFVESGLREKEEEGEEGGGGERRRENRRRRLVFKCGGAALSALASGLMSSPGGPAAETYRRVAEGCAAGAASAAAASDSGAGTRGRGAESPGGRRRRRRRRLLVIAYSNEERSDVTAFLRAGAVDAGAAAASAASSASSSSPAVVVLPVSLARKKEGRSPSAAASGHYLPLVAPRELGEVAAAALAASTARSTGARAKF